MSAILAQSIFINVSRYRATSGGPRLPFGFEEAFKEGRGIQGEKFFKKFFSNFLKLEIFIFF